MATLLPVVSNDLRNAAFQHAGGDKKSFQKVGTKYMKYAKNPGKSIWKSITGIFGFGMIVPKKTHCKGAGRKRKPAKKKHK